MVKNLPSNAGSTDLISGQGTKIPDASWPEKNPKHKSNIVTNSIKMIVGTKKSLKKRKRSS